MIEEEFHIREFATSNFEAKMGAFEQLIALLRQLENTDVIVKEIKVIHVQDTLFPGSHGYQISGRIVGEAAEIANLMITVR